MPRLEQKHSLATRLFHWINVPILAVMIYSGLLIYWANDVYAIRLGGITIVKFFPDWFYGPCISTIARRGDGLAFHLHVVLRPQRPALRRLHGLERGVEAPVTEPAHFRRGLAGRPARPWIEEGAFAAEEVQWRPAARLYRSGGDGGWLPPDRPGHLQTGPSRLAHHAAGRIPAARLEHFVLTLGYVAFFVIHITQVVRAGWNNFRAMVIGVEVAKDEEISYEYAGRPDGTPREYAGRRTASTGSSAGRRTTSTRSTTDSRTS